MHNEILEKFIRNTNRSSIDSHLSLSALNKTLNATGKQLVAFSASKSLI